MPDTLETQRRAFKKLLQTVCAAQDHASLAEDLRVSRWQLRKWLYSSRPSQFAMQTLTPKLERKLQQVSKNPSKTKNHTEKE